MERETVSLAAETLTPPPRIRLVRLLIRFAPSVACTDQLSSSLGSGSCSPRSRPGLPRSNHPTPRGRRGEGDGEREKRERRDVLLKINFQDFSDLNSAAAATGGNVNSASWDSQQSPRLFLSFLLLFFSSDANFIFSHLAQIAKKGILHIKGPL